MGGSRLPQSTDQQYKRDQSWAIDRHTFNNTLPESNLESCQGDCVTSIPALVLVAIKSQHCCASRTVVLYQLFCTKTVVLHWTHGLELL